MENVAKRPYRPNVRMLAAYIASSEHSDKILEALRAMAEANDSKEDAA